VFVTHRQCPIIFHSNNISLGLVPETRETIIAATATKQVIEVHDDSPENPLVPDEDEDRVGGDDDDDVDAIAFIRSEIPLRFSTPYHISKLRMSTDYISRGCGR
jgi:hypothetical protein